MTRENRDDSLRESLRDALRSTLREGDPAADGHDPTPDEVARLRARVLDAAHEADAERGWRWVPATVAAALALLVIAGAVALRFEPGDRTERAGRFTPADGAGAAGEPEGPVEAEDPEGRQIQFTTPGGTRVVWMLYPEDPNPSGRAERGSGGRS